MATLEYAAHCPYGQHATCNDHKGMSATMGDCKRIAILAVWSVLFIFASSERAAAAVCPPDLPSGLTPFAITGTGYTMCYPGQVSDVVYSGSDRGTLSLSKTFKDNGPINIYFAEDNAATDNETEGGLRIKINETVKNSTRASTWSDFHLTLTDLVAVCKDPKDNDKNSCKTGQGTVGDAGHPQYPHFHTTSTKFDKFNIVTGDKTGKMSLFGGSIAPGQEFKNTSTFVLHEPDAKGFKRQFLLTEIPSITSVPIPGALPLFGSGLVALIAFGKKRTGGNFSRRC
ncbi:MAG: hypothetical protein ACYDC8_15550 [Gammaproteobacteria bacterium]